MPVSFIKSADEIEIVDAPPKSRWNALPKSRQRLKSAQQRLSRLRELALVLAADVVDHQLNDYLERHGIKQHFGTHERILVCITPRANMQEMMETAQIMAQRFHGELIVAYVNQPDISADDQAALDAETGDCQRRRRPRRDSGRRGSGGHPSGVRQIPRHHAALRGTQPAHRTLARLWGSPVDKLIRESHGMDVRIFPQ